jgi:hypothetical protein
MHVVRLCLRPAFLHVVAYTRQTSALRSTANLLLHAASYGAQWVLLSPLLQRACRAAPAPAHNFTFGLCLVTSHTGLEPNWTGLGHPGPDGLTRAQQLDMGFV